MLHERLLEKGAEEHQVGHDPEAEVCVGAVGVEDHPEVASLDRTILADGAAVAEAAVADAAVTGDVEELAEIGALDLVVAYVAENPEIAGFDPEAGLGLLGFGADVPEKLERRILYPAILADLCNGFVAAVLEAQVTCGSDRATQRQKNKKASHGNLLSLKYCIFTQCRGGVKGCGFTIRSFLGYFAVRSPSGRSQQRGQLLSGVHPGSGTVQGGGHNQLPGKCLTLPQRG